MKIRENKLKNSNLNYNYLFSLYFLEKVELKFIFLI
jgi:hypothetical protein